MQRYKKQLIQRYGKPGMQVMLKPVEQLEDFINATDMLCVAVVTGGYFYGADTAVYDTAGV